MLMDGNLTSGAVTLQAAANITANDDAITVNITGGGLTEQGRLVCLERGIIR